MRLLDLFENTVSRDNGSTNMLNYYQMLYQNMGDVAEALTEDINIPDIAYDYSKMNGFWIDPDGYIHEVDHDADWHHTDVVISNQPPDPYGEYFDEYGEVIDDDAYNNLNDLALGHGWIRVSTVAYHKTGYLVIEMGHDPNTKALGILILWLMRIPNSIRIGYEGDWGMSSFTGNRGTVLTALEKDFGRKFHIAAEDALSESLSTVKTYTPKQIAKKHGVSLKQIDQQLRKGTTVEHEHTADPSDAREIVLDHLWELPDYYDRLADMEASVGLSEAFDTSVPFRMVRDFGYSKKYEFAYGGQGFTVIFDEDDNNKNVWEVTYDVSDARFSQRFKPTGTSSTKGAMAILSTVISIIQDFIRNDDWVSELKFDGSKGDRLAKMYDAMISNLASRMNFDYKKEVGRSYDSYHLYLDRNVDLGEARKPWLRITPQMLAQAKGNKAQVIVEMPAEQFISMTTSSVDQQNTINQDARHIRDYNRWAKAGDSSEFRNHLNVGKTTDDDDFTWGTIIMPFLRIDVPNDNFGKIRGHEGRHRAASAIKHGNGMVPVALIMLPDEDHPGLKDVDAYDPRYAMHAKHIPDYVKGQFNGKMYSTSDWKIVKDDIQGAVRRYGNG